MSRRAGYFRGGDSEPKPLPPLRERINPTYKAFEDLERLEAELEREWVTPKNPKRRMELDQYIELSSILELKREKLVRQSDALRGVPKAKPIKDTPVVVKAPTEAVRRPQRQAVTHDWRRQWEYVWILIVVLYISKILFF